MRLQHVQPLLRKPRAIELIPLDRTGLRQIQLRATHHQRPLQGAGAIISGAP
jgi:hypothetical protein